MPRAIWSGTISFGLVSVPVRMYSAIDESDLRFHRASTSCASSSTSPVYECEGVITLEKMFCHDEIRPAGEIAPRKTKVAKGRARAGDDADRAIQGRLFEPERYEDTCREALAKIIKAKQKGESIKAAAEGEEDEEPADLLGAQGLRRGGEAQRGRTRPRKPAARKRATRTKTKR